MLTGSLVHLGCNHRRPGTGGVDALGGILAQAASEAGQGAGDGRGEDQRFGNFGGLLDHAPPRSRESSGSDEVFGTSAEDYFDAMPGGGQLADDLRRSERPQSRAHRD
jgi:hypothetical protein